MKKLALGILSLALMTGAPLLAEDAPKEAPKGGGDHPHLSPEERFKKLDTDNNGKLSLVEFKAGPIVQKIEEKHPGAAEKMFKKIDKDNDGSISLEEFKAGAAVIREHLEEKAHEKAAEKK